MSVPRPGDDPNANLYARLKRDVLNRVLEVDTVTYVPDDIEAERLRATFDPYRLDPPTGPEPPELVVDWHRQILTTGSVSTTPIRTPDFTPVGTKTKTTRTSVGHTSSGRPTARRTDAG